MKAVHSEDHRSHDPKFFLVRGQVKPAADQPERADRLLAGLKAGHHTVVAPQAHGTGARARVHSPDYLAFLAQAWEEWEALPDHGAEMIANIHPVREAATYPTHIVGRLGWHTVDTACPIGPGTYAAAAAATDVAASAAQLVLDGEDAAYALCRPPGHHAYRDRAGGHCYFNNSAVAAAPCASATPGSRCSTSTCITATARKASSTAIRACSPSRSTPIRAASIPSSGATPTSAARERGSAPT